MPKALWPGRDTRDLLLDALSLALADDNAKLRAQYPEVFEKAAEVIAARTKPRELSTNPRAVSARRRARQRAKAKRLRAAAEADQGV